MAVKLPSGFDAYTWRARLQPVLVTLTPLFLAFAAWFPDHAGWGAIPFAGLIYMVLLGLLAQVARDRGSQLERKLTQQWTGLPTMQHLRHGTTSANPAIRQRYHALLGKLMPDLKLPNAEEERNDPQAADLMYEACVARLRQLTQERDQFPLVFEENANYGYRRNLVGLRPVGIVLGILGLGAAGARVATALLGGDPLPAVATAATCLDLLLIGLWLFHFNTDWIRIAADAYARQLLAACEKLGS